MFGLENWGLIGLFLGNLLAATVVPFSSDALYIAVLSVMKRPLECFVVATAGNWLGSVITYYMGRLGRWAGTFPLFAGSAEARGAAQRKPNARATDRIIFFILKMLVFMKGYVLW